MSAATTEVESRRSWPRQGRGPRGLRRLGGPRSLPYLLFLPALVVLLSVYAYPLGRLLWLSLHEYTLPQLIGARPAEFVGLAHFVEMFADPSFWTVVVRTLVFAAVCVGLTMGLGLAFALIMRRISRGVRLVFTGTMILAWAMPWLAVTGVFQWMVDYEFGVVNYALSQLPFVDMMQHNWFAQPWQGFTVVAGVVVWQAVPFPTIALHAGLMQIPRDLEEAARVDGAGAWKVFRNVTIPVLKPILLILTIYSIIWDFQVFNQLYVMLNQRPTPEYYLFSVYSYTEAFGASRYGVGAAIALIMVLILVGATFVYIRRMIRVGEVE